MYFKRASCFKLVKKKKSKAGILKNIRNKAYRFNPFLVRIQITGYYYIMIAALINEINGQNLIRKFDGIFSSYVSSLCTIRIHVQMIIIKSFWPTHISSRNPWFDELPNWTDSKLGKHVRQ